MLFALNEIIDQMDSFAIPSKILLCYGQVYAICQTETFQKPAPHPCEEIMSEVTLLILDEKRAIHGHIHGSLANEV